MKTIKVKNKLVSYSEELKGNTYNLIFSYVKPANAHNDALKIEGVLDVFFNMDEKIDSNGRKKELYASSRLFINNKYISSRSYLYKRENEKLYLSEWISEVEYSPKFSNINIITRSDAEMLNSLIIEITKMSELITIENLTPRAEAQDLLSELNRAKNLINEKNKELEESEKAYKDLLIRCNFSEGEFLTFRKFAEDGMSADEALKAARLLEK